MRVGSWDVYKIISRLFGGEGGTRGRLFVICVTKVITDPRQQTNERATSDMVGRLHPHRLRKLYGHLGKQERNKGRDPVIIDAHVSKSRRGDIKSRGFC